MIPSFANRQHDVVGYHPFRGVSAIAEVAAYADDLGMAMANVFTDLPRALKDFRQLGRGSGLHLSYDKVQLVNLTRHSQPPEQAA